MESPEINDEDEIRIDVQIARELSARELVAYEKLVNVIGKASETISNMPDSIKMRWTNGREVTGAELKAIWAKADFVINEKGTQYQNNTGRGEADWNGGDSRISFNIDFLEDANNSFQGTMQFLPFHEIGHLTAYGRDYNRDMFTDGATSDERRFNEQIANDVGVAIARWGFRYVYVSGAEGTSGSSTDFFPS